MSTLNDITPPSHIKKEDHKFNQFYVFLGIAILIIVLFNLLFLFIKKDEIKTEFLEKARTVIYKIEKIASPKLNTDTNLYRDTKREVMKLKNIALAIDPKIKTTYLKENNVSALVKLVDVLDLSVDGIYFIKYFLIKSKILLAEMINQNEMIYVLEEIEKNWEHLEKGINKINTANNLLNSILITSIPEQYLNKFLIGKTNYNYLNNILQKTLFHKKALFKLLGEEKAHKILIIFQNNNEIRPTGGFMGSYILLTFNKGNITQKDFKDIYELDGQFKKYVPSPYDIAQFTPQWKMRDSNYSPDFKLSAEKISWFMEQEGGPKVDTVISVNLTLLETLLESAGPIRSEHLKGALSGSNLAYVLSHIIETKSFNKEAPKEIIKLILPEVEKHLIENINLQKLITKLPLLIDSKSIQGYSSASEVQDLFTDININNEIPKTNNSDFLAVINSSIGGNKSDKFIKQKIIQNTIINKEGEIINEVSIEREHLFNNKIEEEIIKTLKTFEIYDLSPLFWQIIGNHRNLCQLKVIVPAGSKLMSTSGVPMKDVLIKYNEKLNKTDFFTKMYVDPGKSYKMTFVYKLPWKLDYNPLANYNYNYFSQSGILDNNINHTINVDGEIERYYSKIQNIKLQKSDQLNLSTNSDYEISLLFDK